MCSCLTGRPKLQSRIKKLHRRSCLQKIEIFLTLGKTGPDVVLPLSQSWARPWPVPKRSPEGPRGDAAGVLTLQAGAEAGEQHLHHHQDCAEGSGTSGCGAPSEQRAGRSAAPLGPRGIFTSTPRRDVPPPSQRGFCQPPSHKAPL